MSERKTCERRGEALTPWLDKGDHSAFGYDPPHTDARCAERLVEQRDNQRRDTDIQMIRVAELSADKSAAEARVAELERQVVELAALATALAGAIDEHCDPGSEWVRDLQERMDALAALDVTEEK